MNWGEWVILLASIFNIGWFAWNWQPGKFLYWLGATILTIGIIKMKGV
jgi:hypothetical protein